MEQSLVSLALILKNLEEKGNKSQGRELEEATRGAFNVSNYYSGKAEAYLDAISLLKQWLTNATPTTVAH